MHYRLAGDEVVVFVRGLQDLARLRLPEVELVIRDFYSDPTGLEPLCTDELMRRAETGKVTVLDVRPYCMLSVEAVRLLRKSGFQARAMSEGVADWRWKGGEVSVGPED